MKKCAVFNDLSGFGKCSLAADLPILSAYHIEAHPFPTAVLSNQTAYNSYAVADISDYTESFLSEWKKLGAEFNGILTGYFANAKQVKTVADYIKTQSALVVVDPVMGDGGKRYKGIDNELCEGIKSLCLTANVITPNETELAILTGESSIDRAAGMLIELGVPAIVVTGLEKGGKIGCKVYTDSRSCEYYEEKTGGYFSGTGDIFAAVLTAELLSGSDVFAAAEKATRFVSHCCKITASGNAENGVDFELALNEI